MAACVASCVACAAVWSRLFSALQSLAKSNYAVGVFEFETVALGRLTLWVALSLSILWIMNFQFHFFQNVGSLVRFAAVWSMASILLALTILGVTEIIWQFPSLYPGLGLSLSVALALVSILTIVLGAQVAVPKLPAIGGFAGILVAATAGLCGMVVGNVMMVAIALGIQVAGSWGAPLEWTRSDQDVRAAAIRSRLLKPEEMFAPATLASFRV